METTKKTKTQEILDHHLFAFAEADVNELLKDFTEESELLTSNGGLKGLNEIRSFFEETFKIIPKGSTFEISQRIVRDNVAYVAWTCESSFVSIPLAADTLIIENDKIKFQTMAIHIILQEVLDL